MHLCKAQLKFNFNAGKCAVKAAEGCHAGSLEKRVLLLSNPPLKLVAVKSLNLH